MGKHPIPSLLSCFSFLCLFVVSLLPHISPPIKLRIQYLLFAPPCHISTQPYVGREQCFTQPKIGQQEDGV